MEPSQGRKEARGEDLNSLVHHLAGSNLNDLDSQLPTPFAQCGDCDEREASGASSSACTAGSRSLRDRFCKNARQGSSSSSLSAQDSQKSIAGSASSSFSLPDYLRSNWSGSSSSMLGSRQNNSGGSGLLHSTSGERFRKDSAELSGSAHSNSRVNGRLRSAHTDDVTSSWDLGRISGVSSTPRSSGREDRLHSTSSAEPSTPEFSPNAPLSRRANSARLDQSFLSEGANLSTEWERRPGPQLNPAPIFGTGWPAHSVYAKQVAPAAAVPMQWHFAHRCDVPFEDPVVLLPLDVVPPELEVHFSLRPGPDLEAYLPEELARGPEALPAGHLEHVLEEVEEDEAEDNREDSHGGSSQASSSGAVAGSASVAGAGARRAGPGGSSGEEILNSAAVLPCHLIAQAANPGSITVDMQQRSPRQHSATSPSTPAKKVQWSRFFSWKRPGT